MIRKIDSKLSYLASYLSIAHEFVGTVNAGFRPFRLFLNKNEAAWLNRDSVTGSKKINRWGKRNGEAEANRVFDKSQPFCLYDQRSKIDSGKMASASMNIGIPHLELHSCRFRRLGSIQNRLNSTRIGRIPRLSLGMSRKRRSRDRVVCFSVDDDLREKQQELSSSGSGVGSAIEDRPGNCTYSISLMSMLQSLNFI